MGKGQAAPMKMDEFAFILLAGIVLIAILMVTWTTPTELLPKVEPTSINIETINGSVETFNLNITRKATKIELTASGEIASWIRFTKNNFDVSKSTLVPVKVTVPKTAMSKTYKGEIKVSSAGGEQKISVAVDVQKAVIKALSSRNIILGDFFVGFTSGSKELDSKENVEANKGLFSERSINLIGSLTDKELSITNEASINLIIEDSNKLGNLIVTLNDVEVFNKKVGPGEIVIPIKNDMVKKSNVVTIKTEGPGFQFWANTLYQFRSIKLVANFEGAFSKELTFKLKPIEVTTFDSLRLAYRVEDYSSQLPQLSIKINDQLIHKTRPTTATFDFKFDSDIYGSPLVLSDDDNTISFSFDQEASYTIANAVLTVFYRD